jgi:hypothetical protein
VRDQPVIYQRQLVPNGFETLPGRNLLLGFQLIKTARFKCGDHIGECRVETVEGLIHS